MNPATPRTWILTDGTIGMENQCRALADALGVTAEIKRITLRRPWEWMLPYAPILPLKGIVGVLDDAGRPAELGPPWPRLIIACGRRSAAPALALKAQANDQAIAVQIKDPRALRRRFDLIITPRHDRVSGPNILTTLGALHRIRPETLRDAARRFAPRLQHLPRPRVAVLIGGASKTYRFAEADVARLCDGLTRLSNEHGAGLAVTTSRRTPAAAVAALRATLEGLPHVFWNGEGENPYMGYLALADAIVVTEDSVNMASEAAGTGKPVHIAALTGGSPKFARFHEGLREAGITRPFTGGLETWRYTPPDDMNQAVARVRALLGVQGAAAPVAAHA